MVESRNDLILRILDEIAFLAARMTGLKAMGMNDEILKEVERIEQASGNLEPEQRAKVIKALDALRS